jgi:hypothetical protein
MRIFIDETFGYMLKVLKSKIVLTNFKKEFAAIRQGDYYEFINLIGEPIPFMVTYNAGIIRTETKAEKDDVDFIGLFKSIPSLKIFLQKCKKVYGEIVDNDLTDEVFRKVAIFEIGIRMHANNNNLLNENEDLVNVITKLADFKKLSQIETERLQKGRQFLNMIKHDTKQFASWSEGIAEFEKAFTILNNHRLTVV